MSLVKQPSSSPSRTPAVHLFLLWARGSNTETEGSQPFSPGPWLLSSMLIRNSGEKTQAKGFKRQANHRLEKLKSTGHFLPLLP